MSNGFLKLKVRKEASKGKKAQRIRDSFIQACLKLDCSIFEPMISEDEYFEDLDKYRFLASLKQQFDWAIARGAKELHLKKGRCGLCLRGHETYEFYGNKLKPEFSYIITTKSDEVQDIFLCNASSGHG